MKILFLHFFFANKNSFGNNRSYELLKFWADNYDVEPFVLTSDAYFLDEKKDIEFPAIVFSTDYKQGNNVLKKQMEYFRASRFFKNKKISFKPDLVYAVAPPLDFLFLGEYFARKYNVPLVLELMDLWPEVPYDMRIIPKWLYRFYKNKITNLYKSEYVKKIVFLSPGYLDLFKQNYREVAHKGILSYNGTNIRQFVPDYNKGYEKIRLVYSGALGRANNLLRVVRFISKYKNDFSDVIFDIYGWGKQSRQIINYIKKENLEGIINYKGYTSKQKVAQLLNKYHIGISSFDNYKILEANSANKFYDYLASGLSVALNYEGWQAKFLKEYQCGISTPGENTDLFIERLLKLVNNKELLQQQGKNSRRLSEEKFDRQKIAQSLYENIFIT